MRHVRRHHHTGSKLLLITGLWLLFVGVIIGGTLLTPSTSVVGASPALLYKLALRDVPIRGTLPPPTGKAVIADLDRMTVTLYEDNVASSTFPILSKGKPGTPWETPPGAYAIQTKEPQHFSTIASVWLPWSMQFYGNFFVWIDFFCVVFSSFYNY